MKKMYKNQSKRGIIRQNQKGACLTACPFSRNLISYTKTTNQKTIYIKTKLLTKSLMQKTSNIF